MIARVASVVQQLAARRGRRLFTVDGDPVDAPEVNALLGRLAGERMTAKDFRTWRGTLTAFDYLRAHPNEDPQRAVVAAVDAAAARLNNTRAVARDHYIHPHLISTYLDGTFTDRMAAVRPEPVALLGEDEQLLLAFLESMLAEMYPLG